MKCKRSNQSLYLDKNQFKEYQSQELCTICNHRLPLYGDERVRDHCHVTGTFRKAAHRKCNFNSQVSNYMLILFHNFQNYDINLFTKTMLKLPN